MKVNFSLLSLEDTASILDWSSKKVGGILPLSESTFNLYSELRGKIDINSDNKDLIKNDKPVEYGGCFDAYEEAIVNNIMIMLIVKKYFNFYKSQDLELNEHINISK